MDTQKVKRLRLSLTLHFSIIACITAVLVANNGSGNIFLPALIILVSTTAFLIVDLLELFHLGQIGSYIGMAAATVLALGTLVFAAFRGNESSQLMSVAGLLIYPQCVLFFQKKSLRVFEQLAVFLLLQMIVAALINDNIVYGMMLTPMLLAWVSSLFLFARYATVVSLNPGIEEPVPLLYELLYAKYRRSAGAKKAAMPIYAQAVISPASLEAGGRQRWMLSAPLGMTALLFGGALFFFLPRNAQTSLSGPLLNKTGIPDRIDPGFFGRVASDPTPIFRLKLTKDGQSYRPYDPPYLRVDVFDRYLPPNRLFANGNWVRSSPFSQKTRPGDKKFANRDRVKLEVKSKVAAGKSSKVLVSVPPLIANPQGFAFDRSMMVFDQIGEDHRFATKKYLIYSYLTAAFSSGMQVEITPDYSQAHRELLTFPSGLSLAEQWRNRVLDDAKVDRANPYAIAKALERQFRDSGEFKYSLDVPPPQEPTIDPIEDFIVNTKTGLCQHYASALVAVLRQSGIPARIVMGYRPIVWNKMGEFFQVRLADAHAWVEARIEKEHLIGSEHERWLTNEEHYWLHLDPTPSLGDLAGGIEEQSKPFEYAEELWDNYLSNPDAGAMQASYAPMAKASQDQAKQWMASISTFGIAIFGETFAGLGFAWQMALTIIALGTFLVLIWQTIMWLPRLAPKLASRLGLRQSTSRIQHPFYARCVALLESLNLKRPESETLQEFSDRALVLIATKSQSTSALRQSLIVLGSLYHQLRFGKSDRNEAHDQGPIEEHLKTVEMAVKAAKKEH